MLFTILVLASAFLIEGIGTYVSVLGLASLFSSNPIIIVLAVALDIGKVVSVSFLYKFWKNINSAMKIYMTVAAIVLMTITSAGVFGFLSAEFQKAISGSNTQGVMLQSLEEERGRLQRRKEEIDRQIAKLPDNSVRGRSQLIRQFGPEVNRLNSRLAEIDKELPALKIDTIKKNVEVGPIIYIAEAFSTTPEKAVKWIILVIIFVFDPLAISLLLAGNFLIINRKKIIEDEKKVDDNSALPKTEESAAVYIAEVTMPDPEVNGYVLEEPEIEESTAVHAAAPDSCTGSPVLEAPDLEVHAEPEIMHREEVPAFTEIIIDTESPPSKSSLEDIDHRRCDVEMDTDSMRDMQQLRNLYSDK